MLVLLGSRALNPALMTEFIEFYGGCWVYRSQLEECKQRDEELLISVERRQVLRIASTTVRALAAQVPPCTTLEEIRQGGEILFIAMFDSQKAIRAAVDWLEQQGVDTRGWDTSTQVCAEVATMNGAKMSQSKPVEDAKELDTKGKSQEKVVAGATEKHLSSKEDQHQLSKEDQYQSSEKLAQAAPLDEPPSETKERERTRELPTLLEDVQPGHQAGEGAATALAEPSSGTTQGDETELPEQGGKQQPAAVKDVHAELDQQAAVLRAEADLQVEKPNGTGAMDVPEPPVSQKQPAQGSSPHLPLSESKLGVHRSGSDRSSSSISGSRSRSRSSSMSRSRGSSFSYSDNSLDSRGSSDGSDGSESLDEAAAAEEEEELRAAALERLKKGRLKNRNSSLPLPSAQRLQGQEPIFPVPERSQQLPSGTSQLPPITALKQLLVAEFQDDDPRMGEDLDYPYALDDSYYQADAAPTHPVPGVCDSSGTSAAAAAQAPRAASLQDQDLQARKATLLAKIKSIEGTLGLLQKEIQGAEAMRRAMEVSTAQQEAVHAQLQQQVSEAAARVVQHNSRRITALLEAIKERK
ncbi:unnamed protein product [Chrysoparadoxa australica]